MLEGLNLNMFAPSKHAIAAFTEFLRQEFIKKGAKNKITVGISFIKYTYYFQRFPLSATACKYGNIRQGLCGIELRHAHAEFGRCSQCGLILHPNSPEMFKCMSSLSRNKECKGSFVSR